jgi:hypothetical protein
LSSFWRIQSSDKIVAALGSIIVWHLNQLRRSSQLVETGFAGGLRKAQEWDQRRKGGIEQVRRGIFEINYTGEI